MVFSKKLIYMGADHAGYEVKAEIRKYLEEKGFTAIDLGVFTGDSVDYPDIAREVCEKVVDNPGSMGILFCGTGIGMAISANKIDGIRAVQATTVQEAEMSRKHNDANVICFGARLQSAEKMELILEVFINTEFEGGRHEKRVEKIKKIEEGRK
jgi:ribose 5-phosphate isomerase B